MKQFLVNVTLSSALMFSAVSNAAIIDFAGGTAHLANGGACAASDTSSCGNVDYYEEDGFIFDFIGSNEFIGNYYGASNAVVHAHWNRGLSAMEIKKAGGGLFDLNYFILTSNTIVGGGWASGVEETYVEAWNGGVLLERMLLTPDSWGFVGINNVGSPLQNDPQIFLSANFDAVDTVKFTSASTVHGQPGHVHDAYCFGMDMFYIDQAAPIAEGVPAPATLALFGLGFMGLFSRVFRKG
ncbi:PEP-CTERM sorting domain-containing protein [Rheinheimera sp. MMS21-TC3]|uniref:PEP-CTERM sorting domain-containing protein n=1 Tax=Rheinheimera sp. MMS21-TC3 TaxID=3072790 RepID=UPI0028C43EB6|nr:PEP-CTERM sorting domain-containing protein [Rheinheimera sp. MMS21-TC3]WNO60208.1 PEP-CTERM sorting domain-containing protein [Rheinheimera sp. MMS21-TC3]